MTITYVLRKSPPFLGAASSEGGGRLGAASSATVVGLLELDRQAALVDLRLEVVRDRAAPRRLLPARLEVVVLVERALELGDVVGLVDVDVDHGLDLRDRELADAQEAELGARDRVEGAVDLEPDLERALDRRDVLREAEILLELAVADAEVVADAVEVALVARDLLAGEPRELLRLVLALVLDLHLVARLDVLVDRGRPHRDGVRAAPLAHAESQLLAIGVLAERVRERAEQHDEERDDDRERGADHVEGVRRGELLATQLDPERIGPEHAQRAADGDGGDGFLEGG